MGGLTRAGVLTLALLLGATGCTRTGAPAGPQGWSAVDRNGWYAATQGSRLIPWDWAQALERAGEPGKFFDAQWLTRFRLLPRGTGELPVGFAIDRQDDSALTKTKLRWVAGQPKDAAWLGFNCSACHTAEISFKGQSMRVDGGPGLTDFGGLIDALDAALGETRSDPAKFDRFAKAVLNTADGPAARTMLTGEMDKLIAWNRSIARANATTLQPGFARIDAFGHIFNKVALLANPGPDFDPPPPNAADAPVSYPFLWNTHQANRVQWNGIAENTKLKVAGRPFEYGALGRNAGEVIGVYGDVAVGGDSSLKGYASSIRVQNINDLERVLARLQPPTWPDAMFGKPDATRAAAGKVLFEANCARGCHGSLAHDDIKTPFVTTVFTFKGADNPGTDPWMACNAWSYEAPTGAMAGLPSGYVKLPNKPVTRLGETEPIANMLRTAVVGSLVGRAPEVIKAAGATWLGIPPRPRVEVGAVPETAAERKAKRLQKCMTATDPILGYRARPLTGIWATAPYLHNGSVPTLYDVLLPPAQRPASFNLGSRDYDPVRVGYVTAASAQNSFRFVARDAGGLVPGNGNGGHDYGNARFSETDRLALVEYMKTL